MNAANVQEPQVVPAGVEHLSAIRDLAAFVWRAHYPGIISHEQIDYMLAQMYSLDSLRAEIQAQAIHYERLLVDGGFVGFASYGPAGRADEFKLHKLYLLPALHGRGLGSLLLQHCEREATKLGARHLILCVNKRNSNAIAAYRRNGFTIVESVITDIGNGFVMDDYVMAKQLNV